MRCSLISLCLLFVLASGCRHADVPRLPASHGHLSLALDKYLELPTTWPGGPNPFGVPEMVVDPAQAPSVFAEAVQVLRGQPTEDEVRQAAEDLAAACESPFQQACDFLREQFKAPKKVEGAFPEYPREALLAQSPAVVCIRCRLGVDGRLRACEVLEAGAYGFTENVLEASRGWRYQPASLAGHALEIPMTTFVRLTPQTVKPTPEQMLQWTRQRAERSPKSVSAWFDLASMLAQQAPEDPAYVPALLRLNELAPSFWWSSNELAWIDAGAGQYAKAAPLARRARDAAPRNPYVLEVSAATLMGLGQCQEAVAAQRQAVEGLPDAWPAPERERFLNSLREYTQRCPVAAPAPQIPPPR